MNGKALVAPLRIVSHVVLAAMAAALAYAAYIALANWPGIGV